MQSTAEQPSSWLDRPVLGSFRLNWETLLLVVILLLTFLSRFYMLDARVMSHDETIHVYHNSYSLATGQGYKHDPLSHGPLQFHLVALSYFLFGDNDLTARIPAALFSIASVAFVLFYRRYLGRAGMLIAMVMMAISPILLFYGRYVREDIYAVFSGIVMLWAILRYLETGRDRYSFWLILVLVLHFTDKETSFIYAAQALIFLGLYFIFQVWKRDWPDNSKRKPFIFVLMLGLSLLTLTAYVYLGQHSTSIIGATETVAPAVPGQPVTALPIQGPSPALLGLIMLSSLALLAALVLLILGFTWRRLRQERSFGLLVLIGTLVMPMLSAFLVNFAGWNVPTNASEVAALSGTDILHMGVFLVPLTLAAVVVGLLWNPRLWLINAAIFYGFFTVFFTTVFTNGAGFFTGLVGSLGYWLEQQGVQRGSQPWYYYILVQIPVYEFLPALASLFGFLLLLFGKRPLLRFTEAYKENQAASEVSRLAGLEQEDGMEKTQFSLNMPASGEIETAPVLSLLVFWIFSSILAYTIAGEKMPWLTVHITWSMILFGGWAIGYLVETTDWSYFRQKRGWLVLLVLVIFLISFLSTLGSLLGANPPFAGMSLDQLQATSTFVIAFVVACASGIGLWKLLADWPLVQFSRVMLVTIFAGFGMVTARTAFQSSYISYDDANELLVYAHSAGAVKEVMSQVEEISQRLTDGQALSIAFDGEYPFWWYLRHYPNARYFGSTPSRSLRDTPVIIAGDGNFGKLEPIVGQSFDQFEYIRLWWPNQDYYNLTWDRIRYAITNPEMRAALFQVWLNRDYSEYGRITGKDMSLENWTPAARMRLYLRKDITAKLWNYGSAPAAQTIEIDPYDGKQVFINADKVWGSPGSAPGQFQRPRDLAVALDGSIYVADTDNNRIQHLSADGAPLQAWGSFADIAQGAALGGTFNQPWGIALGLDGSVYVADTWNHRVQKFTPTGEFVKMWGYFGTGETPEAFWGPRDIAVDSQGRVYVTDTGNKRIVVFDADGIFITQFGSAGLDAGQFDEPVGVAIDSQDYVYVADTWNQRIQVFQEQDGLFVPARMWDVYAWFGQSLDNKPFLAVDATGDVFAVDPEGYRVLQYNNNGEIIRYWGDYGAGLDTFGLVGSVAVDPQGGVWVSDAGNSRLMHFTLTNP